MTDTEPRARATAESGPNPTVKAIMAYLQERRLHPGDRLPSERDLAERLGVGRNGIREALATLTTLRVLESRPNSGIYLRRVSTESSFETLVMLADMGTAPSPADILETMEVRSSLELLGAKLACERRTGADLAHMATVLDATDQALQRGNNIIEQDTAFHLAMIAATHNGVLVRVLNSFYRLTSARRRAWFSNQAEGESSARDHRSMYLAVQARNTALASALIVQHMERARTYWDEVLGHDG